jgi:hypothetical protein
MPPTSGPALPDKLLEEIFLRLPPNEPACLVRASLIDRFWFKILSGGAFRRAYDEFHGDPQ